MARSNGKTQIDEQQMDVEHELPPSDGNEEPQSSTGEPRAEHA